MRLGSVLKASSKQRRVCWAPLDVQLYVPITSMLLLNGPFRTQLVSFSFRMKRSKFTNNTPSMRHVFTYPDTQFNDWNNIKASAQVSCISCTHAATAHTITTAPAADMIQLVKIPHNSIMIPIANAAGTYVGWGSSDASPSKPSERPPALSRM